MRLYDRVLKAGGILSGCIIGGIALLITVDVITRYFGIVSIKGSLEIVQYLIFVLTAFGAPLVLRENGHVRVDLVLTLLHQRSRRAIGILGLIVQAAIAAVIFYVGAGEALDSFSHHTQIYGTYTFPEWWLLALTPLMGLAFLIETVRRLAAGESDAGEVPGGL